MDSNTEGEPMRLCSSCRHMHSMELVNGHRRRGWCEIRGHWQNNLSKPTACADWTGKKTRSR